MQAKKRERALHDPAQALSPTLPWKSGAEDARTPNADASSADSAASAKRLECVRFIGAFRPARDVQRFIVPMPAKKRKEAFHVASIHIALIPPFCFQSPGIFGGCPHVFAASLLNEFAQRRIHV